MSLAGLETVLADAELELKGELLPLLPEIYQRYIHLP